MKESVCIFALDEYTITAKRTLFARLGHAVSEPQRLPDGTWMFWRTKG